MNPNRVLIPLLGVLCLLPFVPSAAALLSGVALAVIWGNPYQDKTKPLTQRLLTWSVMGLGAGMNLNVVFKVGLAGVGYTFVGIFSTLFLGLVLGRLLRVERDAGVLITVGTAICGGSAIAAIAPTLNAKSHSISVALGTVFLLNAMALLLFPPIGHYFQLSQTQFGLWSALAIHDTSSVVGAGIQYGAEALQVGTTVKLARALWIVPLTLGSSYLFARSGAKTSAKPKRPWFILGFLVAAAIVTWVPATQQAGRVVEMIAKRMLVLTLFLIGANLSRETLKSVGLAPLIQGLGLWLIVATSTLGAILLGLIR